MNFTRLHSSGRLAIRIVATASLLSAAAALPALADDRADCGNGAKIHAPPTAEELAACTRLAEHGDAWAQTTLGRLFETGVGVPQYYSDASRWYRLAADQGYSEGQYLLGNMYYAGRGVPQDFVQAYMWVDLAAATLPAGADQDHAANARDAVASKLAPDQLAKAKQMAAEWKPTKIP